jgi:hypothetical protein
MFNYLYFFSKVNRQIFQHPKKNYYFLINIDSYSRFHKVQYIINLKRTPNRIVDELFKIG